MTELTAAAGAPGLAPSGALWSLLQMVGALLLVCLIAYLLLRGLRRLVGTPASSGSVRVLERCPLSPRHSLWIVTVGERCFLLGSSDAPGGPVSRLAELDSSSLPRTSPGASRPARPSFGEVLARLKGGDRPAPPEAP